MSASWNAIAWNGTVFCAIATSSAIAATSPDGITWTQRTLPVSSTWTGIAWNGTVFCVVALFSANYVTSPDGITWTQRTLPSSQQWQNIASNGTVFAAVASATATAATIDRTASTTLLEVPTFSPNGAYPMLKAS